MTFPDVPDFGTVGNGITWALFGLTCLFVGLRFYCRLQYGTRRLGLDDYITMLALATYLVSGIFLSIGTRYGLGKHAWLLTADQVKNAVYYSTVCCSIIVWCFSLPKLAIVALLQRILNMGPRTAFVLWGLAIVSQAGIFVTSVLWFKQCEPVAYQWDPTLNGSCPYRGVVNALGYSTSALSAFLDIFYALYPIPAIMSLNMPLRNRITISIALGLTSFGSIVSIYKIVELTEGFPILVSDPTYPMPYLYILVYVEACLLMVCASVPALGPIFRMISRKWTTGNASGEDHSGMDGVLSGGSGARKLGGKGGTGGNGGGGGGGGSGSGAANTLVTIGGSSWRGGGMGHNHKFKGGHRIQDDTILGDDDDDDDMLAGGGGGRGGGGGGGGGEDEDAGSTSTSNNSSGKPIEHHQSTDEIPLKPIVRDERYNAHEHGHGHGHSHGHSANGGHALPVPAHDIRMGGIRKTVNVAFSSESLDAEDVRRHRLGIHDMGV